VRLTPGTGTAGLAVLPVGRAKLADRSLNARGQGSFCCESGDWRAAARPGRSHDAAQN